VRLCKRHNSLTLFNLSKLAIDYSYTFTILQIIEKRLWPCSFDLYVEIVKQHLDPHILARGK